MNLCKHQLDIYNPSVSVLLTVIRDREYSGLQYGLKENEPGVLELTMPPDFDTDLAPIDGVIELYRTYGGGPTTLEGGTFWLIRKVIKSPKAIQIRAYSALSILDRRLVAYSAGSAYAEKGETPWDDLLHAFVYENLCAGASFAGYPERNLEPWIVVEPDRHYGPSYVKSAPWKGVLSTLSEIVDNVRANGTRCSFDLVRVSLGRLEFRVYVGPRGNDHSVNSRVPVVISEDRQNLLDPSLEVDWEYEKNTIYGLGEGQKNKRIAVKVEDTNRTGIGPFSRTEYSATNTTASTVLQVTAEAMSALEEHRPYLVFTGSIGQIDGCLYGVHWGWGDLVTAEYGGARFDCYVEAVQIQVEKDGTETVSGQLRSVENV